MKKIELHIGLIILVLLIHIPAAQTSYSNEIFDVLQSASGKVLGGGPVSIEGNLFSILTNPSLLDFQKGKEIGFIHTQQFLKDISYNYIGTGFNYAGYHIAVAFARIGVDNIPDSRSAFVESGSDWGIDYSKVTRFNVADYFLLTGIRFPGSYYGWNAGMTLKFLSRRYHVANGWGAAVDFGLNRTIYNRLLLGVRISNFLGSSLHWSTGENEWIAPAFSYGVKYQKTIWDKNTGALILNVFHYFDNRGKSAQLALGPVSADISVGGEFTYGRIIQFRAGRDQNGQWALGTTLFIPRIEVDYAFQKHNDLGEVHNISIIFRLPY